MIIDDVIAAPNDRTFTDDDGNELRAFMKALSPVERVAAWSRMTSQGIDRIDIAKFVHKWCAESVLAAFEVPMGEEGVGVVPRIPDELKRGTSLDPQPDK